MKKRSKISIKVIILIPVFILGLIAIASNVLSIFGIGNVKKTATQLADEDMVSISMLGNIEETAMEIHTMALSHIIASNSERMIALVDEIRSMESELDNLLKEYKSYVKEETEGDYASLLENYSNLKIEISRLMAYSANGNNVEAYTCANNEVKSLAENMTENINAMVAFANANAEGMRGELNKVYQNTFIVTFITIAVCVLALLLTLLSVILKVIRPLSSAKKEITEIIRDIDQRQGDLTKRVPIVADDEIAALGTGINVFMEKLQNIFAVITGNTNRMDVVVREVMESVQTSNESASDLSALTEELTATMEGMSTNASNINHNVSDVEKEVNAIAARTNEINHYTKKMKEHADRMENKARSSMDTTNAKVSEILEVLNKAIEESESVDQVNMLTDAILKIADETNLLALNASIEAARAGDKGFGVVASQISHLATESQETANRIQETNKIVTDAVHNLAEQANGLVAYMNDSIMPEFAGFVQSGSEYKENASYIEGVMDEFSMKTDNLQRSMQEIAKSITTIANAVEEGFNGVSSVADSTQELVMDMDNISNLMNDNQMIAGELKSEADVFVKL